MTISLAIGLGITHTQNIVSAGGPPVNTVAPSIAITSGGGYAGSTYTATSGTWSSGSPTGQWTSDGSPISGETASTYTMDIALEGTAIGYTETNSAVTADSNTIEMWVPADATGTQAAVMDIRQGITLASSSVTDWASQVGGISAAQATGTKQPTYGATAFNGNPGITFDGGDILTGLAVNAASSAYTIVGGLVGPSSGQRMLFGISVGIGLTLRINTGIPQDLITGVAVIFDASPYALTTNTAYILSNRYQTNAASDFSVAGVSVASGTAASNSLTSTGSLVIGAQGNETNFFDKAITSQLIWTTYLSTADLRKAEGWLAWTTGNSSLLDAGHTYVAAGPTI